MKITPNLSPLMRVFYAVGSIALILAPFVMALDGIWRIALPVFGVMGLLTAFSGL